MRGTMINHKAKRWLTLTPREQRAQQGILNTNHWSIACFGHAFAAVGCGGITPNCNGIAIFRWKS